MKNHTASTLMGLILLLSMLGCNALAITNDSQGGGRVLGSGSLAQASRDAGHVTDVELAMEGTLYIQTGSSQSLQIEAEDNLLDYIQTNVSGDHLVIQTRPGFNLETTRPINYHLTARKLSGVTISSSGDVKVEDLSSPSFMIRINSSGNLSVASLQGKSVHVKIASSGDVEILGGQVDQQTITISSSGEYRARGLASREADVRLTSSGKATIQVSDRLSGRLSSSGGIDYIGNPDVNVSTTSSGRAVQIDQ
ncbi:MAG: head GIN domain-containing protein [Bacteroidota bacterium]